MWVGLFNHKFGLCTDKASCQQIFAWADGESTTAANSGHLAVLLHNEQFGTIHVRQTLFSTGFECEC